MFLTHRYTRMDLHRSDWSMMALQDLLDSTFIPMVTLIDVEIFRADVEVLLLSLSEVKAMSIDWLLVFCCAANV